MGLILLFLLICLGIGGISYLGTEEDHNKLDNGRSGLLLSLAISAVLTCFIWSVSYNSYLDMQEDKAVIEQFESAVQLYAEKGVAEFKPGKGMPSEFTDLKYQNYQTQIGKMIIDLRDKIAAYNKVFVGKQIMKDSWFFSWCIVMPVDGKVLKMKDYLK